MNLLIVDHYFDQDYAKALQSRFPHLSITAGKRFADVASALPQAEAIFALGHLFTETLISQAKRLKWIQALTTGTDAIVALHALQPDVLVTSARGIHAPQMSEMAMIHMLCLAHQVPRMLANQQQGKWERWPQSLLFRKHVVILGTGVIAAGLAQRCKAFEMRVTGVSATPRAVSGFDEVVPRSALYATLAGADFVVCLLPSNQENDQLVNGKFFAAMKPDAYFVNMSRGSVVDEQALLTSLASKRIAGAGLDAFAQEPLPPDHPFWALDNLIVSPKHGGTTQIYVEQILPILIANIEAYRLGDRKSMTNLVERSACLNDFAPQLDQYE